MANPSPTRKRKPTFLWQALLIVLPVAVLAIFGFVSLRQDRLLVQREAADRAQAIAEDLAPKIWAQLIAISNAPESEHYGFRVDRGGNLIFPPPYTPVPEPHPLNLANLTKQQLQQWTSAETTESATIGADSAIKLYSEFVASNPPADFAAIGAYRLGVLLEQQHQPEAAFNAYESVLFKYPAPLSEAGLPLDAFAKLKLLQLTKSGSNHLRSASSPSPDELCSNIIYQPSFLSPRLLSAVASYLPKDKLQHWQLLWDKHESDRALYAAARPHISKVVRVDGLLSPTLSSKGGEGGDSGLSAQIRPGAIATGAGAETATNNRPTGLVSLSPSHGERAGERGAIFSVAPQLFWFTTPLAVMVANQPLMVTNALRSEIPELSWLAFRCRDEFEQTQRFQITSSGGTARRNGMSLPLVEGPATDLNTSYWYVCRSQSEIAAELNDLVTRSARLPAYFGLGVDIAGKRVGFAASDLRVWHEVHYNAKGSGEKKEVSNDNATTILASATKPGIGENFLKVNIYLTSPATLYKLQTARTFWFGSLILFSASAALLGLLAAWRSFRRQLQLSEMKSNFVASVSHELRAPIASVRLMAESLERGKIAEPAKQNEYFRFIGQESRRLSSLIENVLDFSRIERGRKQYEFEPTDVIALAQKTVKLMEPYAAEKQIALKFENNLQPAASSEAPLAKQETCSLQPMLDGRAIQQALVNLLDNAIKHSLSGQSVTVGLEAVSSVQSSVFSPEQRTSSIQHPHLNPTIQQSNNPSLRLFVEDQGEGIPAAEHEKIFERFYRLGSELRRETQGVGIGLSIVKHIVEAHGGRITVRSAPGKGSRFTIELPVKPENNHE
jgi:signal transduction histidine kinase